MGMTIDDARRIVLDYLKQLERDAGCELVMLHANTLEREFGWVFFYNSKRYVETGDICPYSYTMRGEPDRSYRQERAKDSLHYPLHGEEPPSFSELPPESVRSLVSEYLSRPPPSGRKLLLVIDGLDEAADFKIGADFLPATPPPGLKVLLAGRPTAPDPDPLLRTVDGAVVDLPRLSSVAVEAVAREGGASAEVAREIARLAEGDPLVVRFYVETLRVGELHAESLVLAKTGIRGFLDLWWNDQITLWNDVTSHQQDVTDKVIGVLACAVAPMTIDDLVEFLEDEVRLSGLEMEAVLRRLSRLIVGEPRSAGLALAHPRFADYIREERMLKSRRRQIEARFVQWGLNSITAYSAGANVAAGTVSAYVIANLGAHMDRAHCAAQEYRPLASRPWADLWRGLDPSFTGFLVDIERCRRAAVAEIEKAQNDADMTALVEQLITCALTTATVHTVNEGFGTQLYVAALTCGLWSAEVILNHIAALPDGRMRVKALAAVAPVIERRYGGDLLTLALSIEHAPTCLSSLCQIYPFLDDDAQMAACNAISRRLAAGNVSGGVASRDRGSHQTAFRAGAA